MSRFRPIDYDKLLKKFSSRLNSAIKASGASYRTLGEQSGVSYVTICHAANGDSMPSVQTMVRLANALQVPLENLLGE